VPQQAHLRFVRDPVHNYVPYSWLEELIINSSLFQRLRYISQNALAHQTYPSNRTPRFTHSLGTMHLGGRFYESVARNSEPSILREFEAKVGEVIGDVCAHHTLSLERATNHLKKQRDPLYRQWGFTAAPSASEDEMAHQTERVCVIQAVRLACVLHDLGHPVFSHTGEAVLEAQLAVPTAGASQDRLEFHGAMTRAQTLASRGALHEAMGFVLMDHIISASVPEQNGQVFATICLHLARGIVREALDGVPDPHGVFVTLHGLVSSELDADRADYVRRDGFASGFEFGTYVLERIMLCLQLANAGERFVIRPTSAALCAVESFFLERFRIYRWLVFHPSVMRGQVAIQRALNELFKIYLDDGPGTDSKSIRKRLEDRDFARFWEPFAAGNKLDRYAGCDENWLMALFRELLDERSL
jgi:HD superfamily phosphohydrolase